MPSTTFKIFRYQPDSTRPEPFYQDFTLEHEDQLTLLDASGSVLFGPVGEGIVEGLGLSSREVGLLAPLAMR